jgi:hypothetical protein
VSKLEYNPGAPPTRQSALRRLAPQNSRRLSRHDEALACEPDTVALVEREITISEPPCDKPSAELGAHSREPRGWGALSVSVKWLLLKVGDPRRIPVSGET